MNYDVTSIVSKVSSMVKETEIETLRIIKLYCQKQKNGYDCGPFASYFAYLFCKGLNPAEHEVSHLTIREKIIEIANGASDWNSIELVKKEQRIEPKINDFKKLLCICRSESETALKTCSKCNESYHINCIQVFGDTCQICKEEEITLDVSGNSLSISSADSNSIDLNSEISIESSNDDNELQYFETKNHNNGS